MTPFEEVRRKRRLYALYAYGRGRSGGGESAFTPASLFPATGAYYDPGDLATVWQDSARTTPGVVGQPVGALDDKSGNANHLLQATGGFRPILRLSGGFYHLEYDGVDDYLEGTFTLNQPMSRVSALANTWRAANFVLDGSSQNTALYNQTGTLLALFAGGAVAPTIAHPGAAFAVVTEHFDGAASQISTNLGAPSTGNPGLGVPGGLTVGSSKDGTSNALVNAGRIVTIGRALTAPELANTRAWCAAGSGVTL